MDMDSTHLPWDALRHKEGEIPWDALRTFAEAVVHDPDVVAELFDVYTETHETALKDISFGDLYVPAILALAAPHLDDGQRRRIGVFLMDKLVTAGREDDDLALEVLTAAAGTMGPAILPDLLDAIDAETDPHGAWLFLWSLTLLAAETEDADLRRRVVQACARLLERVERNEVEDWEGTNAAWTLAKLNCTEYRDLLERLVEKAGNSFEWGDYRDALHLLEGRLEYTPRKELWEQPVEQWLPSRWEATRNWYARRQKEREEALDHDMGPLPSQVFRFLMSPVGSSLPPEMMLSARSIIEELTDLSARILGVDPLDWDEPTLHELLLEVVPRKSYSDENRLARIAPILEAFLLWLGSEGALDRARDLAAAVHGWSDEIVSVGTNPENWGQTKAFMMQAVEEGRDVRDPAFKKEFIDRQTRDMVNAGLIQPEPESESEPMADEPPIPIVETKPRVGRNEPCPCGSGRKYKKCCGSPTKKA